MSVPRLTRLLALPLLSTLLSPPAARADVLILVAPSVGPNVFNSPNYEAYRDNALAALQSGAPAAGAPGTPARYQVVPNGGAVFLNDLVVTGFPSWRGRADPSVAFGPAFAAETGTRLYFGLSIFPDAASLANGTNARFSISQLSFTGVTTDPAGTLDFGFPAGFYEYSPDYVGLRLNPDGTVRERVTSGPNTQLVDALIGRGSSNAFEVLPSDPGATEQDKIEAGIPADGFRFTGTYTLGAQSAGATVAVVPVPAPPGALLLGLGCAGLALRRVGRSGLSLAVGAR